MISLLMTKSRFLSLLVLAQTFAVSAWALAPRPATDPNAPPPPFWVNIVPIAVTVLVIWFLIGPQMKQRRVREAMLKELKKGDRVVTQGGLIATIVNITGDVVEAKLNEDTKVKMRRQAVAEVLPVESEAGAAK